MPDENPGSALSENQLPELHLARSEPLYHRRVAMVEKATGLLVERGDRCEIVLAQFEVEHREILGHALLTHRLRDGDDATLAQPTQHDLRDALAMLACDRLQQIVAEQ